MWLHIGLCYHISRPIRCTVTFSLEILEKHNDECILILVIYWKKTGLLHTNISNHNIIYSSYKPRKSSSLPLKSSSWLFSLDASLSSCKMSSSLPSSALLMPHFFKDFMIVSLLTHCQEFHYVMIKLMYNRCTGIYKFGNIAYPRRIRRRSNLGHIFRGKKCVLWAGKYGILLLRKIAGNNYCHMK